MNKKRFIITFLIVTTIFLIGLFIRLDYIRLAGIPISEKEFYRDQNGLPYMYDCDSYYNYRLTKNFLDHGYLGDTKINDIEWDMHSYYPPGVPMEYPPLIVYVAAYVYRFINLFANVALIKVCFWIPMFIGPLAGIIAYFFTGRFINRWGAAIAGILTVTSPFYAMRTTPGFFDTDMFILIFTLSIIWLYIEAIQSNSIKKLIIFAGSSAFLLFIFSLAWAGWYYLFYLVFVFSIGYLVYCKLKKYNIKNIGFTIITFTVSFFLVSITTGFSNIYKIIYEPFVIIKMSVESPWSPWPDVYSLVSELKTSSILAVLSISSLAFFIGIIGIIYMLRILINHKLKKRFSKITWFFYSFLFAWVLTSVFITIVGGVRFILLIIPPLAVSAGIMVGILIEYPKLIEDSEKNDFFKRRKNLINIISVSILLIVIIFSIYPSYKLISNMTPIVNDDLWDVSEWIKNNTKKGTVVISDWAYGHLFAAIAERPVTFDGRMGYVETLSIRKNNPAFEYGVKSPGISREYWISRALSTSNEELSYGILNMLATSGDNAYLALEDYAGSTAKSVEILNSILGSDKKTAIDILRNNYYLTEEQTKNIINLTHPDRTTPFILVTTDKTRDKVKDKAHFIFNFGEWDFYKNSGQDYLYSIESYNIENDILKSDNGIEMNMKTWDIEWDGESPYCVEVIAEDKSEKRYIDSNSNFCVIILSDDKKAVVIDKNFENSIFVKLFLKKSNTNHLKSIYKNQSMVLWE